MNVQTLEQDFAEFVVEIREENDNMTLVTKTTGAEPKFGTWWMIPILFTHTIKGTVYEHRTMVRDIHGNKSPVTDWVSETAGDTTPPAAPASFTLDSTIATAKCSFSYTKPTDFGKFEWIVK